MEFEFDKEIDLILRQAARSETVSASANQQSATRNPKSSHLDADELSAFAENALPEKMRLNYISHLADCDRCRKILSGLIQLNSETQSEIIHAAEPQSLITTAPEIPWYRKIFAVPTLAYAMGALILVFAGVGIFSVLQNNSRDAEVSQTYDNQPGGKGMASDGDASPPESFSKSMSNAAATNSAVSTNTTANAANSAAAVAPLSLANSNSTLARRDANQELREEPADDRALSKPGKSSETESAASSGAPPPAPPPPPTAAENNFELDGQDKTPPAAQVQNQISQNQTQITPDTRNVQRAAPSAKMRKQESQPADEAKKADKEKSAELTRVGGKSFTRDGNLWIDTAYRGQATTNISRGTKEYKKLDAGLRGIVENLGGTVIVVWKEKAYRIQ